MPDPDAPTLLAEIASMPNLDVVCAMPPERARVPGFRRALTERLRRERVEWLNAKRERE